MRKTILKPLLAIVCLLSSITLYAHDFEVDGIYYRLLSEENQVAVTYYGDDVYDVPEEYIYTGSVTIPETVTYQGATYSVTSIGNEAFYCCTGLTEIIIPNSVTSIGEEAFAYCARLTEVTIPNSVTSIGERAFNDCSGLISITIGNSVTSIGDHAFHYCIGLTEVTIPNSVNSIGDGAFYLCYGLKEIIISNSVTSIGYEAFFYCTGLTEVTIPNSVTSIGESAFAYCDGLTEVTIGNSVTSIGDFAFDNCERIKDVYAYPAVPPTIGLHTFTAYVNDNATLHVVKGCKEDYSDANYWEYFLNITDDLTADIEDIMVDTDNTPAEYYDLNGYRVDHPTHGIYIMKQGNTVRKVVL